MLSAVKRVKYPIHKIIKFHTILKPRTAMLVGMLSDLSPYANACGFIFNSIFIFLPRMVASRDLFSVEARHQENLVNN